MARFGQGLIQALTNPSYQQGMFNLGSAIGSAPAVRRDQQAKSTAMTMVNEALASQDPNKIQSAAVALQKAGMNAEAMELSKAAGQLRAKSEESRLGRGLQGGLTAITSAARRGVPLEQLTEAQRSVIGLGGTNEQINSAYNAGLQKPKNTEVYSGLTEWVDSSGNVVLKTIQPKNSPVPLELGSNRKVLSQELVGLSERKTPSTSVSISQGGEGAYTKEAAKNEAERDNLIIDQGMQSSNILSDISEARLVLEQNPEVLGFGSEQGLQVKNALLSTMSIFGVSQNDPLYEKLSQQTAAGDMYRLFTQEFVAPRFEATKGAISDVEFKAFIASVPNLMQTPEGYKQVLDFMERSATRAVLKGNLIAEAQQGGVKETRKAKQTWNSFSRDFPVSLVSNESTVKLFEDYQKQGFSKQGTNFLITTPNGNVKQVTYDDIVQTGRKLNISPELALKRAFDVGQAKYIGFIPIGS